VSRYDETWSSIWKRFRLAGELRPLVCLAATIASALLLAGVGIGAGWVFGMTRESMIGSGRVGYVLPSDVRTGLITAGIVWLLLQVWIWRPAVNLNRHSLSAERRLTWIRPLAGTAIMGAAVTVASFVIYRRPWDRAEYAVTAFTCLAGGIVVLLWLPVVFALEHGRPVLGPQGSVNVFCVQCGYSMAGLRATTCPECGRSYTIDELIREQKYEALEPERPKCGAKVLGVGRASDERPG
jgi:hypothetical protein